MKRRRAQARGSAAPFASSRGHHAVADGGSHETAVTASPTPIPQRPQEALQAMPRMERMGHPDNPLPSVGIRSTYLEVGHPVGRFTAPPLVTSFQLPAA